MQFATTVSHFATVQANASAVSPGVASYARRRPEPSDFYRAVAENLDLFYQTYDERFLDQHGPLPKRARRTLPDSTARTSRSAWSWSRNSSATPSMPIHTCTRWPPTAPLTRRARSTACSSTHRQTSRPSPSCSRKTCSTYSCDASAAVRLRDDILTWQHTGFSVDASVRIHKGDRALLHRIARYIARPAVAFERIIYDDRRGRVTVLSAKKTHGQRKVVAEYDVLTFLLLLTLQVPPAGAHMVRYFGWYASRQRGQRRKASAPIPPSRQSDPCQRGPGRQTPHSVGTRCRWCRAARKGRARR